MKNVRFDIHKKEFLGDTLSPVQVYFNLRDKYPNSVLLESSDYDSKENSHSIICCDPVADFIVHEGQLTTRFPGEMAQTVSYNQSDIYDKLQGFIGSFEAVSNVDEINGLFGYISYDGIPYFEDIQFQAVKNDNAKIPEIRYHFYRFLVIFNHFNHRVTLLENLDVKDPQGKFDDFEAAVFNRNFHSFPFEKVGDVSSNKTDEEFKEMVTKGKKACMRGDVFQIVLSRRFEQAFKGDDFTLYRALRSINPSPYLFYFDYGDYKVFGSSPEAQVRLDQEHAEIHAIAGTFKRTGDAKKDSESAIALAKDEKETAEHMMLVDLARNDLSRNCHHVKVEALKTIQYFSHVIHMTSTITGKMEPETNRIKVLMDTFPAGTLSGAPKYKAMQLIDEYENDARGLYAGALGFIGFNGRVNMAIVIRSFVSKRNKLYYQAGAGVVHLSKEENELQEVNNKLGALNKAIQMAEGIK